MGGSQLRFRWGCQSTIPFCSSGRGGVGCAGCPGVGLQTQAHQQQALCRVGAHLVFRFLLIIGPGLAGVAKDRAQEWGRAPLSGAQSHLKCRAEAQWALLGRGRRLRTVHRKAWN